MYLPGTWHAIFLQLPAVVEYMYSTPYKIPRRLGALTQLTAPKTFPRNTQHKGPPTHFCFSLSTAVSCSRRYWASATSLSDVTRPTALDSHRILPTYCGEPKCPFVL